LVWLLGSCYSFAVVGLVGLWSCGFGLAIVSRWLLVWGGIVLSMRRGMKGGINLIIVATSQLFPVFL